LGVIPCFVYSTGLHSPFKPNENLFSFGTFWISLTWLPMSLHYNSYILSWLTIVAIYNCIGFSMICTGLCYYIGFESDESMMRVSITSTILIALFTALRVIGVSSTFISLYGSPITTFGSIVLHLAMLIFSYKRYRYYDYHSYYGEKKKIPFLFNYWFRQSLMVILLLLSLFFGTIWSITGMRNTAYTFTVLYIWEKYAEIHEQKGWSGWVLIFILSVSVYYIAVYLHSNPEFVVSLFNYN